MTLIRDGAEAMEFLLREGKFARAPRPDLVLLDLRLPIKDGLVVLDEIKSDNSLRSIPIVVLTSSLDETDRLKCARLDVESYITKPVNLNKFLAIVHQLRHIWHSNVILPVA